MSVYEKLARKPTSLEGDLEVRTVCCVVDEPVIQQKIDCLPERRGHRRIKEDRGFRSLLNGVSVCFEMPCHIRHVHALRAIGLLL
jgi:hypothetical protein